MKTAASFPEAIFYVLIAAVLLSLSFLFLVPVPQGSEGKAGEEEAEVGGEVELEAPAPTTDVVAPLIVLEVVGSRQQVIS